MNMGQPRRFRVLTVQHRDLDAALEPLLLRPDVERVHVVPWGKEYLDIAGAHWRLYRIYYVEAAPARKEDGSG